MTTNPYPLLLAWVCSTELLIMTIVGTVRAHGMGEEVSGIENFKQWVAEDLSAFPDMKITILEDFGEQNKIAIRWILKATHEKDFADFPATHKKFETQGVEQCRLKAVLKLV